MVKQAVTAKTPISAPGSKPLSPLRSPAALRSNRAAGFTLIELMVVLLLVALVSGLASLALRDGSEARLERDGQRLAALLEAGRAEARASGVAVRFELAGTDPGTAAGGGTAAAGKTSDLAFRFVGLPPATLPDGHWLEPAMQARIVGARALRLGPEPLIGAQRIVLSLGGRELVLATDGLAPFAVLNPVLDPSLDPAQAGGTR